MYIITLIRLAVVYFYIFLHLQILFPFICLISVVCVCPGLINNLGQLRKNVRNSSFNLNCSVIVLKCFVNLLIKCIKFGPLRVQLAEHFKLDTLSGL